MSIWGFGNFDSDDALNVLDELIIGIVKNIRETFLREADTSLYDDFGNSHIVGNIDILSTLLEKYETYPQVELEEVSRWKKDYLDTFDRTIHVYEPTAEYVIERRKVISQTFDRLYGVVEVFWED